MASRRSQCERAARQEAERFGASITIQRRSDHSRIAVERNGKRRIVFISSTQSDRSAHLAVARDIRRAINRME
jgi:hypothetical protein